ncbi:MAG: hypothetical protein IJ682_13460 [Lachnospiraceae bacterium]|nr:hypothetical protein [Lachnospiraceae bacterium]
MSYDIPTMKIKMYSMDDLFEKKLYFLIPFYIFNLEDRLDEYENDEKKLEEMKEMYVNILGRLNQKVSDGELMALSRETIKDLSNKVVQNLAKKCKHIRKGQSPEQVADLTELPIDFIRSVEQSILQMA